MQTKKTDPRDLVLAIVAFNKDKRVEGRTFLQKLAYFLNEKLKLGIEFEPHYYGPYSESIAMATKTLVELDFLKEGEELFSGTFAGNFEPRRYTYVLTPAGQIILNELQQLETNLLNDIKRTIKDITTKEGCEYKCLSLAAKIVHILKSQNKPMTESELSKAAKDLGWKLSREEIDEASKFLRDLGIMKEMP